MSQLKIAKAAGTYLKELARIEKQDVLILDDFGIQPLDSGRMVFLLDKIL